MFQELTVECVVWHAHTIYSKPETGLEHANKLLEDKVAGLHDQNEFWEEEGQKLKDQVCVYVVVYT